MASVSFMQSRGYSSPGAPSSPQEHTWKQQNLVKPVAIRSVKTLWVHRSVSAQMNALNLYLQHNGARLGEKVDDWGFANRDIRGIAGSKSMHSWGLAEDLDATENPMGVRRTTFASNERERDEIRKVCKWLGLKWGYDWDRPDPMHFESQVSRDRAKSIKKSLLGKTWRSWRMAKLCGMKQSDFRKRVAQIEDF